VQTLAARTGLPLFLHNRNVGRDLYDLLQEHRGCWKAGGVVHSYDDTADLAQSFQADLGLYIGVNGCSLRTEESLEVLRKALPLDRLLLETDCPYCEVRPTHPGYSYIQTHWQAKAEKKFQRGLTVKNRQEPCHILLIAEIVAAVQGVPVHTVAEAAYKNSLDLFGWTSDDDGDEERA
jgi:TatD DNase family protein